MHKKALFASHVGDTAIMRKKGLCPNETKPEFFGKRLKPHAVENNTSHVPEYTHHGG